MAREPGEIYSTTVPRVPQTLPQRLINTHTHKLVEFSRATDITPNPPYAILSHTWVHGEEVTLQEFTETQPKTKKKSGYGKILDACKQARRDGFSFIWIDTCCIDATNPRAVAEDINSMYSYYQNSQICYAYLSDVTIHKSYGLPWKKGAFLHSRWFTRGWTLQELLAPSKVVFFNANWDRIGSKSNRYLCRKISSLTGIPRSVLSGKRSIEAIDIWERMTWCVGRKTTKPPDLAYCLLGILSISMEPDYGEGVDRAFERLEEQLAKAYPGGFSKTTNGSTLDGTGKSIYSLLVHQNVCTRLEAHNEGHDRRWFRRGTGAVFKTVHRAVLGPSQNERRHQMSQGRTWFFGRSRTSYSSHNLEILSLSSHTSIDSPPMGGYGSLLRSDDNVTSRIFMRHRVMQGDLTSISSFSLASTTESYSFRGRNQNQTNYQNDYLDRDLLPIHEESSDSEEETT